MEKFDVVGVGCGPANLSLAALMVNQKKLNSVFLEKQKEFKWHEGMLLDDAKLQVSFLKDLVTLADPTNPYSFLNYLIHKSCLYQFITSNFSYVSRIEFNHYLRWVFNNINAIRKSEEVTHLNYVNNHIEVETSSGKKLLTKNIVLGTGLTPYVPEYCHEHICDNVFHNSEFLHRKKSFKNARVAIIGGGQSGAEIVNTLIKNDHEMPEAIYWYSRRLNFLPIDDSPFTNELFTPHYTKYFYSLHPDKRQSLLLQHKLASDGISENTAEEIYRRLYEIKFIKNINQKFYLRPSHALNQIEKKNDCYMISLQDLENNTTKQAEVDYVILCTGYKYKEPEFLKSISRYLNRDKFGLVVDINYKLSLKGINDCNIYLQNGSSHVHGVADPNLSLLAYRSATILNQILGDSIYQKHEGSSLMNWIFEDQNEIFA